MQRPSFLSAFSRGGECVETSSVHSRPASSCSNAGFSWAAGSKVGMPMPSGGFKAVLPMLRVGCVSSGVAAVTLPAAWWGDTAIRCCALHSVLASERSSTATADSCSVSAAPALLALAPDSSTVPCVAHSAAQHACTPEASPSTLWRRQAERDMQLELPSMRRAAVRLTSPSVSASHRPAPEGVAQVRAHSTVATCKLPGSGAHGVDAAPAGEACLCARAAPSAALSRGSGCENSPAAIGLMASPSATQASQPSPWLAPAMFWPVSSMSVGPPASRLGGAFAATATGWPAASSCGVLAAVAVQLRVRSKQIVCSSTAAWLQSANGMGDNACSVGGCTLNTSSGAASIAGRHSTPSLLTLSAGCDKAPPIKPIRLVSAGAAAAPAVRVGLIPGGAYAVTAGSSRRPTSDRGDDRSSCGEPLAKSGLSQRTPAGVWSRASAAAGKAAAAVAGAALGVGKRARCMPGTRPGADSAHTSSNSCRTQTSSVPGGEQAGSMWGLFAAAGVVCMCSAAACVGGTFASGASPASSCGGKAAAAVAAAAASRSTPPARAIANVTVSSSSAGADDSSNGKGDCTGSSYSAALAQLPAAADARCVCCIPPKSPSASKVGSSSIGPPRSWCSNGDVRSSADAGAPTKGTMAPLTMSGSETDVGNGDASGTARGDCRGCCCPSVVNGNGSTSVGSITTP
eukprot:364003-Chlamydomonas_euryale.AAC.5